MFATKNI